MFKKKITRLIRNLDSIFICQHFRYYFKTPWINYDQKYILKSSLEFGQKKKSSLES